MFRKTKKPTAQAAATTGSKSVPSILSRDMHILGNIVCEGGMVDFDATLDGNLRCEHLTVRPNGIINGEITATHVTVYGKVNGLIKAKNVQLCTGCHIEGIVMHEQLSVEDGAFIDGKCKRTDKPMASAFQPQEEPDEKTINMLENIRLIR
jgi:cytoskeletal protein CcmA (bactofilin family)